MLPEKTEYLYISEKGTAAAVDCGCAFCYGGIKGEERTERELKNVGQKKAKAVKMNIYRTK